MSIETKNMFEDEWRRLAMEKQWANLTSITKAEMETYYPDEQSLFSEFHKSVNRGYYVDAKQPTLPYVVFLRVQDPMSGFAQPCKHIPEKVFPSQRDTPTTLGDIATNTIEKYSPPHSLWQGTDQRGSGQAPARLSR